MAATQLSKLLCFELQIGSLYPPITGQIPEVESAWWRQAPSENGLIRYFVTERSKKMHSLSRWTNVTRISAFANEIF